VLLRSTALTLFCWAAALHDFLAPRLQRLRDSNGLVQVINEQIKSNSHGISTQRAEVHDALAIGAEGFQHSARRGALSLRA
jgi:hypothetical protein